MAERLLSFEPPLALKSIFPLMVEEQRTWILIFPAGLARKPPIVTFVIAAAYAAVVTAFLLKLNRPAV
jgi:hypothetical protein